MWFYPTKIINFNYTSVYNTLYPKVDTIDYIHGKINVEIEKNTMVLGYNGMNDSTLDYEFSEFIKYFQMTNNNISYSILNQLNPKEDQAMFFGHSMDETDSDIIKEVVENTKIVFIVCYDSNSRASAIKNLIKIYGETEFRRLCFSNDKKIYFVNQHKTEVLSSPRFHSDEMIRLNNILQPNECNESNIEKFFSQCTIYEDKVFNPIIYVELLDKLNLIKSSENYDEYKNKLLMSIKRATEFYNNMPEELKKHI